MNNSISIQSQSIVSSWSPSGHGQMLPEASLKFHLSGGSLIKSTNINNMTTISKTIIAIFFQDQIPMGNIWTTKRNITERKSEQNKSEA